jgi:hypothetical protein
MSVHTYSRTFRDYSGELSNATVSIPPITAIDIAGTLILIGLYETALDGFTLGQAAKSEIMMDRTVISAANAGSAVAQRELKWLVRYHGIVANKKATMEIPTPDITLTDVLVPGTDIVDLTQTQAAAFVTAFENLAIFPETDTEGCLIDQIVLVGRNL